MGRGADGLLKGQGGGGGHTYVRARTTNHRLVHASQRADTGDDVLPYRAAHLLQRVIVQTHVHQAAQLPQLVNTVPLKWSFCVRRHTLVATNEQKFN